MAVEKIRKRRHRFMEAQKNYTAFAKAAILDPRGVGTFLPCSRYVGRTMASYAKYEGDECVVDLGAGTGVITRALLRQGVPPERIVMVECSPPLARRLRATFPHVLLIEGDGVFLSQLLGGRPVGTIISSVPMRSLPQAKVKGLIDEMAAVLPEGGRYVHVTYDLRGEEGLYPEAYHLDVKRYVWRNLPPAKVVVYHLS